MEEDDYNRMVLSDGRQVCNDEFWVSENANMLQSIFDICNELGFGEGEDWMLNTDVPCKHQSSAQLFETKPANSEEHAESKYASGHSFSSKCIVENDTEVNDATEMLSPNMQGLCQKQPFLTHFVHKEISDVTLEALSVERNSLTDAPQESEEDEEDSDFIRGLVKQFSSLIEKEKSFEGNLGNGNVEHLVSKVDNAVKFEMMLDKLWMKMKDNRDDLTMNIVGNGCKTEKRESQLETVKMRQNKVQEPKDNRKLAHAEKKNATQKVCETRDRTIHNALKQSSEQEGTHLEESNNSEKIIEVVSMDDKMFPSSENKECQVTGHKVFELWKAEVTEHRQTCDRLRYLEGFLSQFHREAVRLNSMLRSGPIENTLFTLTNFFKRLTHLQRQGPHNCSDYHKHGKQPFKVEFIERLRDEMHQLEGQKNRLENEQNLVITKAREIDEKNKAAWMEKEKHFISEIVRVKEKAHWLQEHIEKVEANHIQERCHWKDEVEMCRNECKKKLDLLHNMLKEREEKLRKESDMWSRLLEAKDEKLDSMEFVIKKVVHTLKTIKSHLSDLERQLISQKKRLGKDEELGQENEASYTCSTGSAFELHDGSDIFDMEECGGLEMQMLLEKLATDTEREIRRLSPEIRKEHDRLEKENNEGRLLTVQAKQEKLKIEENLSETLFFMECFTGEMESKEAHLDQEKKQLVMLLKMKSEEIEKLRDALYSKEQETQMETQKVLDEIVTIKRELETERTERQRERDLYISSRQKTIKEIIEKEEIWVKQMKGVTEQFFKLKEENLNKDHEIEILREKINDILTQSDAEKLFSGAAERRTPAGNKKQLSPEQLPKWAF